jgi:hypothetical protein
MEKCEKDYKPINILHRKHLYSMLKSMELFLSRRWDNVSELRTPTGLLFTLKITYEYDDPRWNDTDR